MKWSNNGQPKTSLSPPLACTSVLHGPPLPHPPPAYACLHPPAPAHHCNTLLGGPKPLALTWAHRAPTPLLHDTTTRLLRAHNVANGRGTSCPTTPPTPTPPSTPALWAAQCTCLACCARGQGGEWARGASARGASVRWRREPYIPAWGRRRATCVARVAYAILLAWRQAGRCSPGPQVGQGEGAGVCMPCPTLTCGVQGARP